MTNTPDNLIPRQNWKSSWNHDNCVNLIKHSNSSANRAGLLTATRGNIKWTQTFQCQRNDSSSRMCSVAVWDPEIWFTCCLSGVCSNSRRMKGMSALIRAAELALFEWTCVYSCLWLGSFSSREIGAALRQQWPCSHPSQFLLSSISISFSSSSSSQQCDCFLAWYLHFYSSLKCSVNSCRAYLCTRERKHLFGLCIY